MPRDAYVPKHRAPASKPARRTGIRTSVLLSGVAVAATGLTVTTGILAEMDAQGSSVASLTATQPDHEPVVAGPADREPVVVDPAERERSVSRSQRRTSRADTPARNHSQKSRGPATPTKQPTIQDPRSIARAMLPEFGFSDSEFGCLDALFVSESDWDPHADNPTSSAYGIPQALTGGTHDDLPVDYMTNPASQIRWGLGYIRSSYGTPCSAWAFKQSNSWY
ncbi:hypothetical protein BH18ACT9_BH18ACT9_06600 [soil metagenome]